jgi:cytoskeletal protein CcmA (bactofilin family)
VNGNVTAHERVEVKSTGRMTGDLVSPKVQMADGATFSGRLETRKPGKQGASGKDDKAEMVA